MIRGRDGIPRKRRYCKLRSCGHDLEELGRRRDAEFCSPTCKATYHHAKKAVQRRPSKPREGVTVYVPTLQLAELLAELLWRMAPGTKHEEKKELLAAIDKAIERRKARG